MINKPPVKVTFLDKTGLISREWNLFFQSLATGDVGADWVPTFASLTGSPTITAKWFQQGKYQAFFTVTINGTSASTAGTTYINNFPGVINADSVILAANSTTLIGIGTGLAKASNNRIYTPTWNVTSQIVTLSGVIETT